MSQENSRDAARADRVRVLVDLIGGYVMIGVLVAAVLNDSLLPAIGSWPWKDNVLASLLGGLAAAAVPLMYDLRRGRRSSSRGEG